MPVLAWLDRLETEDRAKHDAVVYALQVILAREGADVCGTEFGKSLGKGLYEFRLRHTRDELQAKAEPHRPLGAHAAEPTKVLIRVFFAVYGDKIVLLLGGYDKATDDSRRRQNKEIAQARARLRDHQHRLAAEARAARRGRAAPDRAAAGLPEDRVPRSRSFLMWSRRRRRDARRRGQP